MSAQLETRTKIFAIDAVRSCADLPRVPEIGHIRSQLQRCSTSVAANYRAACRGKSKPDFIAKLGTVEEEADESRGVKIFIRKQFGEGRVVLW